MKFPECREFNLSVPIVLKADLSTRWIAVTVMPCLLSEGKKINNKDVNMYYDLSQRSESDHEFLVKIIQTGDESCVHWL